MQPQTVQIVRMCYKNDVNALSPCSPEKAAPFSMHTKFRDGFKNTTVQVLWVRRFVNLPEWLPEGGQQRCTHSFHCSNVFSCCHPLVFHTLA